MEVGEQLCKVRCLLLLWVSGLGPSLEVDFFIDSIVMTASG